MLISHAGIVVCGMGIVEVFLAAKISGRMSKYVLFRPVNAVFGVNYFKLVVDCFSQASSRECDAQVSR
jgi:hypothetical protein